MPQVFFYRAAQTGRANSSRKKAITFLWSTLLFCMFGAMALRWVGLPIFRLLRANSWEKIPAVVVESNVIVESHDGEVHLTVYRSDILFEYHLGGRTFHSNCYNFTEGSTLIGSFRENFVKAYPAGRKVTCYVDPNDPAHATLTRHVSMGIAYGLWPGLLAIIGLMGIISGGDEARLSRILKGRVLSVCLILVGMVMALILTQIVNP